MNVELSPEIPVLQEITRALVRERNVRTQLETVLDILHRRMGMLRGTFTLLEGDELRIEASTEELNAEEKALGRYRIGEGITGMVARTGRAEVVRDIREDRRFLNRTGARDAHEAISFICVPLVHLGQVIGTLSVDREMKSEELKVKSEELDVKSEELEVGREEADVKSEEGQPGVSASLSRRGEKNRRATTPLRSSLFALHSSLERDVALLEIIANITADAAAVCREQCAERAALADENRRLREILGGNPGEMIGNCREMRAVYEQIRQVAPSDATVLIRGASGTGKELVARAIRDASSRRDKPFVTLNCAALPENLVESELFGHEKGAFTDAFARRIGRAEAADGGTLFLDEIGDLSVSTQVKLLRFLQERTFSRVGSNEERHADVRFIAATSRNLEDLMARRLFREDLYYRLSVFPIMMPDLAQRTGDIVLLAEHFMAKMNVKYGRQVTRLSPPAVNMLLSYKWPGNVRELENCIERAVLTAKDDCIHGYNLPPSLQAPEFAEDPYLPDGGMKLEDQLNAFERRVLEETIRRHKGNRSAAGRELGVSPRMMNYRLNRLGIRL